jgi:hypothetical protein
MFYGASTLNSVSYGGIPMTKVYQAQAGTTLSTNVAIFILGEAGINSATSNTFSPSWSSTWGTGAYSSAFFDNVNQTTPVSAHVEASSESGATISTSPISTNVGDMVIIAATNYASGSYTLNNGFTEGIDQTFGSYYVSAGVSGHKAATGVSETASATFTSSNSQAIMGMVLQSALPSYDNCAAVQAYGFNFASDLNGDCYVNMDDLKIVSNYWLNEDCAFNQNCMGADFPETDGTVDFIDFSKFAQQWLNCNDPQNTGCTHNWE